MSSEEQKTETKRDRVRRCLITPLTEAGFRKPGNVKADRHEEFLVKLADHLGYMSDAQLDTLRAMLAYRGQGPGRDAWPGLAAIMSLAETVAPRPIEEHPTIVSWFRSARGPEALAEGVLLAEFLFLEKRKRPPIHDGEKRAIRERAAEMARQRQVVVDRRDRGFGSAEDDAWLRWHDALEARAMALLPREDAA